jgi:hypothetical protein
MIMNVHGSNGPDGIPFSDAEAGAVDQWSERIYAALKDWPVAKDGEWRRLDPGYLLLRITRVDGRQVEPIDLYTADGELTVEFGCWETHNPAPYELWDAEPEIIAEHAKSLVESWLSGQLRTAVLTDAHGRWCSSKIIESGDLLPQLIEAARWTSAKHPVRIEVRTPVKSDWQVFKVEPDWLLPMQ